MSTFGDLFFPQDHEPHANEIARAAALGLRRVAPRIFVGERNGVSVSAMARGGHVLAENQTARVTQVCAELTPPLDLGLVVSLSSLRPTQANGQVSAWREVGSAADEPARLARLLDERWRTRLASVPVGIDVRIDDGAVRVTLGFWRFDAATDAALTLAADFVQHARSLANHIPPAAANARHVEPWHAYARLHGLGVTASPLSVWGAIEGSALSARIARSASEGRPTWTATFQVAFPDPLPFALDVSPSTAGFFEAFAWAFDGDVRIGHAAFDNRFRVHASDAALARRVLGPVAQALHDLSSAGEVRVAPTGVTLTLDGPGDPAALGPMIDALRDVTTRAHRALVGESRGTGPYR